MNRDVPPVKLGYEVDTASEARVKQSTQQFIAQLKEMSASGDGVTATAQRMTRQILEEFSKQNSSVRSAVSSETAELEKLQASFAKTGDAAKKGLKVEGLRRTGGALTQLGFGEIGGAVSRVGDLGQLQKEAKGLVEELGPLAPVMAAGAGAAIGLKVGLAIMDTQLAESSKALVSASNQLKIYYEVIATGTTQSINQEIALLELQKRRADEELKTRKEALEGSKPQAGESGLQQFIKVVAQIRPDVQKLNADFEEAKNKADGLNDRIEALKRGLGSTDVAINNFSELLNGKFSQGLKFVLALSEKVAEAQAKLGAELRKAGDAELEKIKAEQRVNNELTSFSYEQAQSRIKSIENEKAVNDKIILTRGLANAQLDRNSDEYKKNTAEMRAATDANKNLNIELNVLKNAMDKLPAEIDAANQRLASATQKYNDDVKSIETKSLEERANIQQKYNDKLVELARNAADAASAALRQLEQAQADATTSLGRDQAKAVRDANDKILSENIKAAREDEKAATDHYRRVADIQRAAQDREFDLIANRDFAGLFMSRRQTTRDIEGENIDFNRQRQDAQSQRQQTAQDDARAFEAQRRERLIAYQNQLADAKLAYQRDIAEQQRKNAEELKLAAQARTKDLQDLQAKTAQELRLKSQAYDAELRIVSLYGQARVAAEANIQKALLAQGNARLAALTSGASGGTYMTQNTTSSNKTVNVNASGYGVQEVVNTVYNVLKQVLK